MSDEESMPREGEVEEDQAAAAASSSEDEETDDEDQPEKIKGSTASPAKKRKKSKKNQPGRYSQLVIDTIRKLGERNGSSLAKVYNEAKKVPWFDQQNGRTYLRYSIKALVQNDTLLQVKGTGANGSFKLNRKKLEGGSPDKDAPAKPAPSVSHKKKSHKKKPQPSSGDTPKKSHKKKLDSSPKKSHKKSHKKEKKSKHGVLKVPKSRKA